MAKHKYGLPYKGSKSKLADEILSVLPAADCLVDVFAGGCAISDCALQSGKYKKVVANDIIGTAFLFDKIAKGIYKPDYKWISREEFFATKDTDLVTAIFWSFGYNCRDYIYSRKVEPYKHALHQAIVDKNYEPIKEFGFDLTSLPDGSVRERRLAARKIIREQYKERMDLESVERLEACERLDIINKAAELPLKTCQNMQNLENLDNLNRCQNIERFQHLIDLTNSRPLECHQTDYRNLEIPDNAIIYCDPPYIGTNKYNTEFDHEAFYDWCEQQTVPVFISEYNMPEDRFVPIWSKQVNSLMCATDNSIKRIEKIWIPKNQLNSD